MANKMLIDATQRDETRMVVMRGNRVEEFDFESQSRRPLKSNIYLAKITRVEPSLQAAFVEYGGNRHGFLAFSEIHPDYYQIPQADREALLAEEAAIEQEEEQEEARPQRKGRRRRRPSNEAAPLAANSEAVSEEIPSGEGLQPEFANESDLEAQADAILAADDETSQGEEEGEEEAKVEMLGGDNVEEAPRKMSRLRKSYKIQDVIRRRQVVLIQVVKEERGNKGAAVTTYLSLAGRYAVLMPNTARGGGISRKITNSTDRKRLKDLVSGLDVPQGMGVILRTAGGNRTTQEIGRDFEYLMRVWENVRDLTLKSQAPCLVHEEGSLIKRAIRDLYGKEVDELIVAGEEGFTEARDFMKMLMPTHTKHVQLHRDPAPLFARHGVETQLDAMFSHNVTLKSGGYIVINQTEALVAIDVNSGRSTKEHDIENTALRTNLEAADEVARQVKLRDLAGLIVVDFIDMEERRNNRAVEKRMKDALKNDRARIQIGFISPFGLLEMSRQRLRAGVLESSSERCPHCSGTGLMRSKSSLALQLLRGVDDYLQKSPLSNVKVKTHLEIALYLLNNKKAEIAALEQLYGLKIEIIVDNTLEAAHSFHIERGDQVHTHETAYRAKPLSAPVFEDEPEEVEAQEVESAQPSEARRGRNRRRGRGGREETQAVALDAQSETEEASEKAEDEASPQNQDNGQDEVKRRRKRRRRGGNRAEQEGVQHEASPENETAVEGEGQPTESLNAEAQPENEAQPKPQEGSRPRALRRGKYGRLERRPRKEGDEQNYSRAPEQEARVQEAREPISQEQTQDIVVVREAVIEKPAPAPEPAKVEVQAKKEEEPAPRLRRTPEPEVVQEAAPAPVSEKKGWWRKALGG